MNNNRRNFLKTGLAAAGVVTLNPYIITSAQEPKKPAPSDRLRLGMIACGDMGCRNARDFDSLADIVAMADVNTMQIDYAMNDPKIGRAGTAEEKKIDTHKDYRRILDRKDIDVVSIATPDHWHIKPAAEALMAGKHVYCEKPLTLTLEENRLIRNACKKYGTQAFQIGTGTRSSPLAHTLVLMNRKGLLGEVKHITASLGGGPKSPGLPVGKIPETLDYDFWIGQAPMIEYRASKELVDFRERKDIWPKYSNVFYNFRWWLDYSGGKLTDWGAHFVDIALWAANRNGPGDGPVKIVPKKIVMPCEMKDGYPVTKDRYCTPSEFEFDCIYEDDFVLTVTNTSPNGMGIYCNGSLGNIHFNQQRIKGKRYEIDKVHETLTEEDFTAVRKGKKRMRHKDNFFDVIRNGGETISDVPSHVQAMNVCHLCGIAARLNREIHWDPKEEKILGDEQAQSFFARTPRKGFEIPRV